MRCRTGKVGLNYHVDSLGMFYVSAARGYKAGGVNLTPNTPDFLPEWRWPMTGLDCR